jgi:hypothetical protein
MMDPSLAKTRLTSSFDRLDKKNIRIAILIAGASAVLALGAVLCDVHQLRATLESASHENSLNVQYLHGIADSAWTHSLMLAAVLVSTGALSTRTAVGLILSASIVLSLDIFLFLWMGHLDTPGFGWPRTGGANLMTAPLFFTLVVRAIGEITLIVVTVSRSRRAKVDQAR